MPANNQMRGQAHPHAGIVGTEIHITSCDVVKEDRTLRQGAAVDRLFLSKPSARDYVRANYKFFGKKAEEDIRPITDDDCDKFIVSRRIE